MFLNTYIMNSYKSGSMSFTKIFRNIRKKSIKNIPDYKTKVRKWRVGNVMTRVEKPTNPVRAHSLGYKAKKGYLIVRGRIKTGGRRRPTPAKGRNPSAMGLVHFTPGQKRQSILEQRVAKKYPNTEVINSYEVGKDGQYHYFEVILVDLKQKSVAKTAKLGKGKGRAFRGRTSAGRKARMKLK